jgi:hypothetical protein
LLFVVVVDAEIPKVPPPNPALRGRVFSNNISTVIDNGSHAFFHDRSDR